MGEVWVVISGVTGLQVFFSITVAFRHLLQWCSDTCEGQSAMENFLVID